MTWLQTLELDWELLAPVWALLGPLLTAGTIVWILATKKNQTSAVAWCLVVLFLPFFGPLLFLLFGYQHVSRPLRRKRRQRQRFRDETGNLPRAEAQAASLPAEDEDVARLACRFGAFPVSAGNQLTFYHEGDTAFPAMLDAIRAARHHIHLEMFIFQPDSLGQLFLDTLAQKAREGVQVRLLYDAMGTHRLGRRLLESLWQAGGKSSVFLPINPFRRRIQINMRNHRKILVVDGQVGFVGGMNVGDEYRGRVARFGFWRDTQMKLEGPAVAQLQHVFAEDWDFAAGEDLRDAAYFPSVSAAGAHAVQIIDSGPDRELKSIREMYFAAVLRARQRVWIASPYFVPDDGLLDALCLAGYLGVDVRFLGLYQPDKWIPFFAGRYYWREVLNAGVKVYQYTKGMMHSKVVLVDGQWASVGTANFDIRSLHLNFEVNALLYAPEAVALLEEAFRNDLKTAIRLDRHVFARRPFGGRLLDNACRLVSPVL
jgi:cardiolipin synthase